MSFEADNTSSGVSVGPSAHRSVASINSSRPVSDTLPGQRAITIVITLTAPTWTSTSTSKKKTSCGLKAGYEDLCGVSEFAAAELADVAREQILDRISAGSRYCATSTDVEAMADFLRPACDYAVNFTGSSIGCDADTQASLRLDVVDATGALQNGLYAALYSETPLGILATAAASMQENRAQSDGDDSQEITVVTSVTPSVLFRVSYPAAGNSSDALMPGPGLYCSTPGDTDLKAQLIADETRRGLDGSLDAHLTFESDFEEAVQIIDKYLATQAHSMSHLHSPSRPVRHVLRILDGAGAQPGYSTIYSWTIDGTLQRMLDRRGPVQQGESRASP